VTFISTNTIQYHTLPFKLMFKFLLTQIYPNTSLIKITILVPMLYMQGGYYSLGKLATVQGFSLNLMTNNSAQNCKRKTNCSASRPQLSVLAGQFIIHMPFLIKKNHILNFLLCAETPNYCCVILCV
jgi:hypothetical protein